jgi:hypothetical protein
MEYRDEHKPMEGEVMLWTVATGSFPGLFASRDIKRRSKAAIKLINKQEGFCGYHPVEGRGTLCLFVTENQAKAARNVMRQAGIPVGDNICTVFVPIADVDYAREKIEKFNAKQKG